jgi:hypothetical protein
MLIGSQKDENEVTHRKLVRCLVIPSVLHRITLLLVLGAGSIRNQCV